MKDFRILNVCGVAQYRRDAEVAIAANNDFPDSTGEFPASRESRALSATTGHTSEHKDEERRENTEHQYQVIQDIISGNAHL